MILNPVAWLHHPIAEGLRFPKARFTHLNDGDLDFSSKPGHTVCRVRLPVAGTKAAMRGAK